jgi:dTDP-L-rhamnose 4-epimerase
VDALVDHGYDVAVLDNLTQQVHPDGRWPSYTNPRASYARGDVASTAELRQALADVSIVVHNASAVGIAQSQYEISRFALTNVIGTANLYEIIVRDKLAVQKIIVPASMSSYGEGVYACGMHGIVRPGLRQREDLAARHWEPRCPECKEHVVAQATPESAASDNYSVYSLSKSTQEQLALLLGRLYAIPTVVFRYFNVYGPRQSISNPYTGVTAIFSSRLKNGNPPIVYEDGLQTRDFVSVHDVVKANLVALATSAFDGVATNLGSGDATPIVAVAEMIAHHLEIDIQPQITGEYRLNDIRHCYADLTLAKKNGFAPTVTLNEGLRELAAWAAAEAARDTFDVATDELKRAGLLGQ